ncbi:unnamed protein product [Ectocarpus sp. 12 AP-2014]
MPSASADSQFSGRTDDRCSCRTWCCSRIPHKQGGAHDTKEGPMATSAAWKHFSPEQISCLEAALEHEQCKTLLALYLGLGGANCLEHDGTDGSGTRTDSASARTNSLTEKERVVLDFHYYNYAFCKERRFDARATSTFLSIMKDVLDEDMRTNDSTSSLRKSFNRFEELILRHAVDRPPWTTGVLSPKDIGAITDYVATRQDYYRHFTLYKHIFTTKINVVIEQRHPHGVEEPPLAPALGGALMMTNVPAVAGEEGDQDAMAIGTDDLISPEEE